MNALLLVVIIIAWLIFAYKFYGDRVSGRLVRPDDSVPTPACAKNDGVDFVPSRTAILFGHHFSSIAGAGPIVGPLLGVMYFGWLAASIWVALGSVFIGAVHDYLALMISVRNDGISIGETAEKTLGRFARNLFSVFVWLALVLIIAVFAVVTAQTFVAQPQIVIPTFGLIPVAILFGLTVNRLKLPMAISTIVAMVLVALLLYWGENSPVVLPATILGLTPLSFWFYVLLCYSFMASILPVWFLLQPRDYLSSWFLYAGMAVGLVGLILAHPPTNAPALVAFSSREGPLWPMMFVLIACGAVSGFHSLVASGTSSKQLSRESHGKIIGYGAMIVEACLAAIVIGIAAGALIWDPSATPSPLGYQFLMSKEGGGPITAFARGFGVVASKIPGITFMMGIYFGMLMLNAFVITTLDTSARLGRFIFAELVGARRSTFVLRSVATVVTLILAGLLGSTEGWKTIWPVFGAANQLIAALALIAISAYLVGVGKPRVYTLIPAIFMLLTTTGALVYQAVQFAVKGNLLLCLVASVLVLLGAIIAIEARTILARREAVSSIASVNAVAKGR